MPPGLTLTVRSSTFDMADLVLAGTPRKRGTYHFTIVATNLFGTSTLPVTLRVLPPPGFDMNADGIPDLAVGTPGENVGKKVDAGVVARFPTTPQLHATGSVQHQPGARGVPVAPESGDRFGASLASGGRVIGSPGEDIGKVVDAGSLTWG